MVNDISEVVATLAAYLTLADFLIKLLGKLKRQWKPKQQKNFKRRHKRKRKK